ncbi:ribbon-helix-helix domain-containing protein [Fodinibius halophilus]|nr:ribbon-helix-helix domain-containing protein [Fodinibius halophilus]
MADADYDFEHHLKEAKDNFNNSKGSTDTTESTGNKDTTGGTQYPFSVRLDEEYVELIKALAWWKRISQREFIEITINEHLKRMESEKLTDILNKYKQQKS